MAERPAVNALPLIFLSQAGLLDMLKLEGEEIVVPRPVAEEIQGRGTDDPTVEAIEKTAWLKVVEAPPVPDAIRAWDLGEGESSVLAWGHANPGTIIIVDDLAARRCAATHGIPVRGTLGLVLTAPLHWSASEAVRQPAPKPNTCQTSSGSRPRWSSS